MKKRHEHGLQGRIYTNIMKRNRFAVKKDDEDIRRDSKKHNHNKKEDIRREER